MFQASRDELGEKEGDHNNNHNKIDNHHHNHHNKHMAYCNQCGFEWSTKVEKPKTCTRCKRYDWNEPKKGRGRGEEKTCTMCGGMNGVHQKGCSKR